MLPILLAITPFGLIVGATATATGLPLAPAIAASYLVFAGSSQLAAYALIGAGSPILIVLVTTLLLNLRFALYSATLAPHLRAAPAPLRALLAAIMTDQSMALGSARFGAHPERGAKIGYYAGVSLLVWFVWTTASTIGVFVGAAVSESWSLSFAVTLVFLSLWVGILARGRAPVRVAGAVAAAVAVLARPLPANLGLLVAAFVGIAAGLWWELRRGRS